MTTSFFINEKFYSVNLQSFPPDITLNTFIREYVGLSGTKFMCQEGGCGVCICVVQGKHSAFGENRTWAVNSCLTLLNSCNGLTITTIEGIGNKLIGYHSIQKRLVKLNGTQCGYCSPGFVMNMYALLKSKNNEVTMEEIENAFAGNMCRCTGYRPILDAMKSFAVDSNIEIPNDCKDIEDLTLKSCPKTGNFCNGNCKRKTITKLKSFQYGDGCQWYWPQNLSDIFKIFNELDDQQKYTLIAGNTAQGVYRRPDDIKHFIDINGVPELCQFQISTEALVLGGNLSLAETMEVFQKVSNHEGFEYCKQLWRHFDLIANVPVRNTGTLAGNLTIKHQNNEFPSDIFTAFEALDVQIVINENESNQIIISLSEYLKMSMSKKVIYSFILKPYSLADFIFDSYKIMPRAQNAHAYINAAFLLKMQKSTNTVVSSRICFGGISCEFAHAKDCENYLVGNNPFDKQLTIFQILNSELKVDHVPGEPSPYYKRLLASGLFYKFLLKHYPIGSLPEKLISGGEQLKRPVSSGKQLFDKIEKNNPIHQPIEKHEGLVQASGEAKYTNDLPVQTQQLWAAFVTGKKIGAKVTKIDTSAAMKLPGVVAFLSAKDIPGTNLIAKGDKFLFQVDEELFPVDELKYYDQPIGVIVAESNTLAQKAAELVELTYSGGSAMVIPNLKSALMNKSVDRMKHTIKSPIDEIAPKGEYNCKGSGKIDMGLQYHYFMEPQTSVVLPNEGGVQVYTATQWMDVVQITIANLLNLKLNEVQVKVRRLGGGYGGKATRCNLAACGAALAAYKLNRPVRVVQSMESMMTTLGKRWAFSANYDFYVNKQTGKIAWLSSTFYEDAGWLENESPMGHTLLLSKNCYEFKDNYKLDGFMVLTDSPNNTACRAPGSVEGIAMIENIIEHIAFETGLDSVDVRFANMVPGHIIEKMLSTFVQTTNYKQRKQEIQLFNEKNRWRKKGLGLAVSEYSIGYFGQYSATLAVYHADGTVVITHGGIEMGQGMNTKVAQVAAHALNIPINMVKIEGSDTINGANSMVTGGSIGSEVICFAVQKCCDVLNERLKTVRDEMKNPSWDQIVKEAYNRQINLIVSEDCKQSDLQSYTVCGTCLTEIEIDVLTGNYLINRVDILEDTGESLNPYVDVGQIEGAFMMGLGYWTSEKILIDETTGEVLTNRTWNYKPPGAKDIPIDFRIQFLPQSANKAGFRRSKATGEPAICLAISIAFAMQHALQSAREDAGLPKSWINLSAPMTPEQILLNSGTDINMMKFL